MVLYNSSKHKGGNLKRFLYLFRFLYIIITSPYKAYERTVISYFVKYNVLNPIRTHRPVPFRITFFDYSKIR